MSFAKSAFDQTSPGGGTETFDQTSPGGGTATATGGGSSSSQVAWPQMYARCMCSTADSTEQPCRSDHISTLDRWSDMAAPSKQAKRTIEVSTADIGRATQGSRQSPETKSKLRNGYRRKVLSKPQTCFRRNVLSKPQAFPTKCFKHTASVSILTSHRKTS